MRIVLNMRLLRFVGAMLLAARLPVGAVDCWGNESPRPIAMRHLGFTDIGETLIEVSFALDDLPPRAQYHTVRTLWLSTTSRGMTDDVFNWTTWTSWDPDQTSRRKAAECVRLMATLVEPKQLPLSANEIVTVTWLDSGETRRKSFPRGQVPVEIQRLLTSCGNSEDQFSRLMFKP